MTLLCQIAASTQTGAAKVLPFSWRRRSARFPAHYSRREATHPMKKIALFAVSSFALALAACGSSDDASEDAMADNVEMPADEALANVPDPVTDEEATEEEDPAVDQATAEEAGDAAVDAAAAAAAAADAPTDANE
jgi:hypothetical protein